MKRRTRATVPYANAGRAPARAGLSKLDSMRARARAVCAAAPPGLGRRSKDRPRSSHGRRSGFHLETGPWATPLRVRPNGRAVRGTAPSRGLPRKEVIQPQLPLRLPCYDFTPVTGPTFDGSLLAVGPPASGVAYFRGVTGGVYKARERIHRSIADLRLLATPPSCRRVSACNPNRDAL